MGNEFFKKIKGFTRTFLCGLSLFHILFLKTNCSSHQKCIFLLITIIIIPNEIISEHHFQELIY